MKKALLFFTVAVTLFACSKDAVLSPAGQTTAPAAQPVITNTTVVTTTSSTQGRVPVGYNLPSCILETETPLMAGQSINTGSVTVWNDDVNVYVSYYASGNYRLKKTHLYVGSCAAIPVNNAGNPRIGQFPYQTSHGTTGVQEFVYSIPRSGLPAGCLCVAAHAEVVAFNASGSVIFSQTGWGFGEEINDGGSWAMKFSYCQQDCDGGGGTGSNPR